MQLPALSKAVYNLRITNLQGQQVYTRLLNLSGGVTTEVIQLPSSLAPGVYNLQVLGDGVRLVKSFVVQ